MKTATVRQIRLEFPALLRVVQNGESVVITSHRKPVATLSPPPAAPAVGKPWAGLAARLAKQRERPSLELAKMLSEDREDRR